MNGPANWGAGTVDFARTLGEYPGAAVAVGLYLSDATTGCNNQPLRAIIGRDDADVTAGNPSLITQYRAKVDEMVNRFKSYDRDVLLRIGYEFDGPWNCYSADFYKEAFRYIKGRIDALGATRVATVWQSAAWPVNTHPDHPEWNYIVTDPGHLDDWYPGDRYVDWVGLSSFYNSAPRSRSGAAAPTTPTRSDSRTGSSTSPAPTASPPWSPRPPRRDHAPGRRPGAASSATTRAPRAARRSGTAGTPATSTG
ncbi:hypothetical protein ACFQ60_35235 [Streptomyces zhihengii]